MKKQKPRKQYVKHTEPVEPIVPVENTTLDYNPEMAKLLKQGLRPWQIAERYGITVEAVKEQTDASNPAASA